MGVNSDIPGTPFQPLPAAGAGSGITAGDNANFRANANTAAQSVAARQRDFMSLVEGSSQAAPNNYSSEIQAATPPTYDSEIQKLAALRTAPDADYIKAGALLVERRDEVDAFINWVLFGK